MKFGGAREQGSKAGSWRAHAPRSPARTDFPPQPCWAATAAAAGRYAAAVPQPGPAAALLLKTRPAAGAGPEVRSWRSRRRLGRVPDVPGAVKLGRPKERSRLLRATQPSLTSCRPPAPLRRAGWGASRGAWPPPTLEWSRPASKDSSRRLRMLAGACILIPGLPLRAAALGHSLRSPCGDRAGSLALLPTRRSLSGSGGGRPEDAHSSDRRDAERAGEDGAAGAALLPRPAPPSLEPRWDGRGCDITSDGGGAALVGWGVEAPSLCVLGRLSETLSANPVLFPGGTWQQISALLSECAAGLRALAKCRQERVASPKGAPDIPGLGTGKSKGRMCWRALGAATRESDGQRSGT